MKKTPSLRFPHLDCISGCALNWCCTACGGCWHGVWGRAGTCCCGTPTWHWDGGPACWDGWWWGCCCCCLYRDRLKKRPRMAFRFPFLISGRQSWEVTRQPSEGVFSLTEQRVSHCTPRTLSALSSFEIPFRISFLLHVKLALQLITSEHQRQINN